MKKKNLKLVKDKFNPKNKTHRHNLYKETFLQHSTESLLFTLQKEAINLTSKCAITALDPTSDNLFALAEAIGDLNIAIEVNETAIPKLHEVSIGSKYRKLTSLNENNESKKEQRKKEEPEVNGASSLKEIEPTEEKADEAELAKACTKAKKAMKEFSQSIPEKRSIIGFFKHCYNY